MEAQARFNRGLVRYNHYRPQYAQTRPQARQFNQYASFNNHSNNGGPLNHLHNQGEQANQHVAAPVQQQGAIGGQHNQPYFPAGMHNSFMGARNQPNLEAVNSFDSHRKSGTCARRDFNLAGPLNEKFNFRTNVPAVSRGHSTVRFVISAVLQASRRIATTNPDPIIALQYLGTAVHRLEEIDQEFANAGN